MLRLVLTHFFLVTAVANGQWDATGRVPLYGYQDPSFRATLSYSSTTRLAVDRLDRIVATVFEQREVGGLCTLVVQRFFDNGVADLAFGANGIVRIETDTARDKLVKGVFVDSVNSILIISSDSRTVEIHKILADGRIDSSYGTNGRVVIADAWFHLYGTPYAFEQHIYLACDFHYPDSSRKVLIHLAPDGRVQGDSVRLTFNRGEIVVDSAAVFRCYGRTIEKWFRSGEVDSTFGDGGTVKWERRSGGASTIAAFNIDDTTLASFGVEEDRGPATLGVESFVVYVDKRNGKILRHLRKSFYVWTTPSSHMQFAQISDEGIVTMAGYRMIDNTFKTSLEFFRFTSSDKPDSGFFNLGGLLLHPKSPDSTARLGDLALLSNNDVIFIESTRMLGRLHVKPTSVDEYADEQRPSITVFPNPTTEHFELSSTVDLYGCTYTVTSIAGEMLVSGILVSTQAIEIPSSIPSGVYALRVMLASGESVTLGLVVVR